MSGAQTFDWIPFYEEFARKLLEFRNSRPRLIELLKNTVGEEILTPQNNSKYVSDIDPFTAFSSFNYANLVEAQKRITILSKLREEFKLQSAVPQTFDGVPTRFCDNTRFFFDPKLPVSEQSSAIDKLWQLFEAVLTRSSNAENLFNELVQREGLKEKLTVGLYWIAPRDFLPLDYKTAKFLNSKGIKTLAASYKDYQNIMDQVNKLISSDSSFPQDFPHLAAAARGSNGSSDQDKLMAELEKVLRLKKVLILEGAPGTGKTYAIPELAVRLCNGASNDMDRQSIMQAYKKLADEGRIVFTTFHQSLDYEDFIEGLKPVAGDNDEDNQELTYEVEDGIFKILCTKASAGEILAPTLSAQAKEKLTNLGWKEDSAIWKVSLQGSGENEIRRDCFENDRIRIGWVDWGDDPDEITNDKELGRKERSSLRYFLKEMKPGDLVISCFDQKTTDGIGVISGDYERLSNGGDYPRSREVKWVVKDVRENIAGLINRNLTRQTVYHLWGSLDAVLSIIAKNEEQKKSDGSSNTSEVRKPYILVIDEINRGNVAKIFGELITLLEADKREGAENEISCTLPYSKERFTVPSNLYIIGTMNTADRSIGSLDYAMRRRFAFAKLRAHKLEAPGFREDLFQDVSKLFVSNYDDLMTNPNAVPERSAYLADEFDPEDLWIGHSYFLMRNENDQDVTAQRIKYEIVPILREYLRDGIFTDAKAVKSVINELLENA